MLTADQKVILSMAKNKHKVGDVSEAQYKWEIANALEAYDLRDFPGSIYHSMYAAFLIVCADDQQAAMDDLYKDSDTQDATYVTSVEDMEVAAITMAEEMALEDSMALVERRVREHAFVTVGINEDMFAFVIMVRDKMEKLMGMIGYGSKYAERIGVCALDFNALHLDLIAKYEREGLNMERVNDARLMANKAVDEKDWPHLVGVCMADIMAMVSLGEASNEEMKRFDAVEKRLVDEISAIVDEIGATSDG